MVPRADKQVGRVGSAQRAITADRTVAICGAVHPPRHAVDGNLWTDLRSIVVGAHYRRSKRGIIGQGGIAEAEFRYEIRHVEIAEMLSDGLPAKPTVRILVHRLRKIGRASCRARVCQEL